MELEGLPSEVIWAQAILYCQDSCRVTPSIKSGGYQLSTLHFTGDYKKYPQVKDLYEKRAQLLNRIFPPVR
jgi:hypothetical protein